MKYLFFFFLLACGSKESNWDTGANKQQMWGTEQRQEAIESTGQQFTSPGVSGRGSQR